MKQHARQHPHPETGASPAEDAAAATAAAAESAAAAVPAAGEPSAPAPGPDEATLLRQQLEEWKDKSLRARADLDNYRRRVQREMGELRAQERAATLAALLSVLDHFQMARDHFAASPDLPAMKQGLDMIGDEFRNALASLGVQPFDATGQPFDPSQHEAVSQEASESVPAGHVLRQWKTGYRLGDQLLRPAVVVVSSGAPTASAPAPDGGGAAAAAGV
jgi:molecular chaperone GrpE